MGTPFPTPENLFIHWGVGGATGCVFGTTGTTAGAGSAVAFDLLTRAFQSFFGFVFSALFAVVVVFVFVVVDDDDDDAVDSEGTDGKMGAPGPSGPF